MRSMLRCALVVGLFLSANLLRAEDQAEARTLVDKAIKAAGGEEKLAKWKGSNIKGKGKFHGLGNAIDYTGEWNFQSPDKAWHKIEAEINGMRFTIVRVINGDKGWMRINENTSDLPKEALTEFQEDLYGHWIGTLVPLKSPDFKLSLLGETKVGDRPVVGLQVTRKDHRDVNLYFDKDTNLLLKLESRVKEMDGSGPEVTQEAFYENYAEVEGIQQPKKATIKRDGKDYVDLEVSEIILAEKLDENLFSKP